MTLNKIIPSSMIGIYFLCLCQCGNAPVVASSRADIEFINNDITAQCDTGSKDSTYVYPPNGADSSFISTPDLSGYLSFNLGMRPSTYSLESQWTWIELDFGASIEEYLLDGKIVLHPEFRIQPILNKRGYGCSSIGGELFFREVWGYYPLSENVNIKIGRQIISWGSSDYFQVVDIFPRDFTALIIGRDNAYIKTPIDALRFTLLSDNTGLDIVLIPRASYDAYPNGEGLTYWDNHTSRIAGNNRILPRASADWWRDNEYGICVTHTIDNYDLAIYALHGVSKSPGGYNTRTNQLLYPRLLFVGSSCHVNIGDGIGYFELGYFDKRWGAAQDQYWFTGDEFRSLLSFEKDILSVSTMFQYHLTIGRERITMVRKSDEVAHSILTQLKWHDEVHDLTLSLCNIYDIFNHDGIILPEVDYHIGSIDIAIGGRLFFGAHDYTWWGQSKNNTNIFVRLLKYY